MSERKFKPVTVQEYLTLDRMLEGRREFANGKVVIMPGGSIEHSTICGSIIGNLHRLLKGTGCRALDSAMRIYCPGPPSYRYADASIVCGAPLLEGDARDILLNPCAVFEVLSPSTARLDRTVKLLEYQSIPSLREILLVEQDQPHVQQVYRRDDGTWELRIIAGLESKLALASVPAALSLGDLYAQVEFPATEEAIADCED